MTNIYRVLSGNGISLFTGLALGVLPCYIMANAYQNNNNLVKNPSFEQEVVGDDWITKDGQFERHHSKILKIECVHGEHYAELASDKGYKHTQKIGVVPEEAYELAFYTQARPRVNLKESEFLLKVDGQQLDKIQPIFEIWQKKVYRVIAQSNQLEISFEDLHFGRPGVGAMIDLVSLTRSQTSEDQ